MSKSRQEDSATGSGSAPFGDQLDGFAAYLHARGYPPLTIQSKLCFVRKLARWLEIRKVPLRDLDEGVLDQSLGTRAPAEGRRKALLQFLEQLREEGIAGPSRVTEEDSPLLRIEQQYARYLSDERGVAKTTVINYGGLIHRFLIHRFGQHRLDLARLTSRCVANFLLRQVQRMSHKRAQLLGSALRSFLHFLFLEAKTAVDLSVAVPTVRQFRMTTVPQYLPAADVERVLASCNLTTAVGRRDHAILLLLARLGLRAGEVASLELDDVCWREGMLVVRGKGKLNDRLPLLKEIGKALTVYLSEVRAPCLSRRLFLGMRAPLGGFVDGTAVSTLVRHAIERAGLHPPHRGAHLFRHSLATGMIRHGASMAEIAQLLRHRSLRTTELYAKVDFEGLRGVALPWLGNAGGR
jgi:site-specific recombinase XerD